MKIIKASAGSIFLLILILTILQIPVLSQSNGNQSIKFPKGFQFQNQNSKYSLTKDLYDTLKYETLSLIKQDFKVNTGCGEFGSDQQLINVANDQGGNFLCVWNDTRVGDKQINGQLFNYEGSRIGPVINVSEGNSKWNSEPHIVYNKESSEYIVSWAGTGVDIYFQRISATGEKIDKNIMANQFLQTNSNNPSAAIDSSGNIIITWISDTYCCSSLAPYCRIFNREGIPITGQWNLAQSGNNQLSSLGWDDRIASDTLGRCLIVWSAYIGGNSQIVFQSVNVNGNGSKVVIVSDSTKSTDNIFPTIASTDDGHFFFLWQSEKGLEGRIYNANSGIFTPQLTLDKNQYYGITYSVSSDKNNNFYVSWFNGKLNIEVISESGQILKTADSLSFSPFLNSGSYPHLSHGLNDRIFLVFNTYQRQMDVMLQRLDMNFNPVGNLIKVADDNCSSWQTNPVVKFNRNGESLIVWADQRNGYHQLFGQVLNRSGVPILNNIQISDTGNIQWISNPEISEDNDGNFIVSFGGGSYSREKLILQKISSSGTLIGYNKMLTDNYYSDFRQLSNIIKRNSSGNFLLSWYPEPYSSIFAQEFDSQLNQLNTPLEIFHNNASSSKQIIDFATNSNFNILVLWVDFDFQTFTKGKVLKAMILDKQGNTIKDTIIVNTLPDNFYFGKCKCSIDDNNNLLFAWNQYNEYGIYSKLIVKRFYDNYNSTIADSIDIDNNRTKIQIINFDAKRAFVSWDAFDKINAMIFDDINGINSSIRLKTLESFVYLPVDIYNDYSVDVSGDKLLFGYESAKNWESGYDIYANIQKLNQNEDENNIQSIENTASVYPNPGSSKINFRYKVMNQTNITISVYNILGQKVADIENSIKSPGIYTSTLQTKNLAAGVYFFIYRGVVTFAKKFIIFK